MVNFSIQSIPPPYRIKEIASLEGIKLTQITIYTQPDCPPCEIAKRFLTEYGFSYELKDIKKDKNARNELMNTYNSFSTPTFVINNKEVVTGFEIDQLKEILNIK
jgi:glutaredoxin-like YruB-family protein